MAPLNSVPEGRIPKMVQLNIVCSSIWTSFFRDWKTVSIEMSLRCCIGYIDVTSMLHRLHRCHIDIASITSMSHRYCIGYIDVTSMLHRLHRCHIDVASMHSALFLCTSMLTSMSTSMFSMYLKLGSYSPHLNIKNFVSINSNWHILRYYLINRIN